MGPVPYVRNRAKLFSLVTMGIRYWIAKHLIENRLPHFIRIPSPAAAWF